MAKKKKKAEKPPREFTRRQLSLHQRQKRRQRIIFGGGVFIVAAVILILMGGWFFGEYLPRHQTVIAVGDVEFDMDYYIDAMKFAGRDQPVENIQNLTSGVVQQIEQNELIRQGAMRLGISVSDDEVRRVLEGYGIPVNDASLDMARAQLLQGLLYNEYFPSQIPESGEQVHIMTMLLESESQAAEIRTRLQNSENFSALAEEFTLHYYFETNVGDIGWHPKDVIVNLFNSFVPGNFAFSSEAGALSEPMYDEVRSKSIGYWLINVLGKPSEDSAQVQGILLGSEEEAKDVRAKLEAGEDLVTLVAEFSQHNDSKVRGGEFGLVMQGVMSEAVDSYVFDANTEVGVWSEPLRDETMITIGGYWLVEVVDKDDDRKLSDEDRNTLINKAYNDWVTELWMEKAAVINHTFLTPEVVLWAIDKVVQELRD